MGPTRDPAPAAAPPRGPPGRIGPGIPSGSFSASDARGDPGDQTMFKPCSSDIKSCSNHVQTMFKRVQTVFKPCSDHVQACSTRVQTMFKRVQIVFKPCTNHVQACSNRVEACSPRAHTVFKPRSNHVRTMFNPCSEVLNMGKVWFAQGFFDVFAGTKYPYIWIPIYI